MKLKLVAVIVCALLLSISLATFMPVHGAGMTPTEGPIGTEVVISGLTPNIGYVIQFDGDDYKTGTAPTGGSVSFTVAEMAGGAHSVTVENPPNTGVLTATFTVIPSITIDTTTGYVGTTVTMEGLGFGSAEKKIKVLYDDTTVKTGITADDDGTWTTTFKVPDSTNGTHTLDALGETTDEDDVTDKTYTVSPKIAIQPASGGVGTSVTITGTSFDSAESGIEVTYDNEKIRTGIVANVNGSWNTNFKIPSSTKGSHTIDASGDTTDDDDVDDLTFSVLPGISITPTSGYAGDEIDITGTGFANNENNIKVTFGGKVIGEDIDADDEGNWSTSVVAPPAINGDHVVDAYGNTTVAADVLNSTFTVEPLVTIKPREGSVGETIHVEGTGFSGKKDYTVTYGDATVSSSLTTDSDGSFSTSFVAPENMSGDIKIVATDSEGITASGVFSMETTAPPVPRIAAPKDGGRVGYIGDVKVTFDWTDVQDPSGVHYELEVSTQSNFSTTLLRVTDLNDSQYTLTEAEALSHGEYYWRVRAIDDAGNASDWTQLSMVKAGYITMKTLIIIICCVVAFIILISIVPRIVRKVMKMKSTV